MTILPIFRDNQGSLLIEWVIMLPLVFLLISSITQTTIQYARFIHPLISQQYNQFTILEFISSLRLDLYYGNVHINQNSKITIIKNELFTDYELRNQKIRKRFQTFHSLKQRVVTNTTNLIFNVSSFKIYDSTNKKLTVTIDHPSLKSPQTIPFVYNIDFKNGH